MQRLRIHAGAVFYLVEVSVRPSTVQAGLIQVLRRPDEDPRFAADG